MRQPKRKQRNHKGERGELESGEQGRGLSVEPEGSVLSGKTETEVLTASYQPAGEAVAEERWKGGGSSMTKSIEEQERFIELRAVGMSFQKISEVLGISKPTLIKWNGELLERVKEAQYLEYERLMEQYGLFRKERFEVYCKALRTALKEFQERAETGELKKVPTDKLFSLLEQLEKRLEKDTSRELLSVRVQENFHFDSEYLELG